VLTSSPLPPETPGDVVVGSDGPAALAERLRSRPSGGDVHVVGGVLGADRTFPDGSAELVYAPGG